MVKSVEILTLLKRNYSLLFITTLLFLYPYLVASPYQVVILTTMMIWAIFALSYDILLGQAGILSFGHTAPFGVAAYLSAYFLSQGYPFIMVLFISIISGALVNLIIGILCSKAKGVYYAILSLALAETLRISIENIANMLGISPTVIPKLPYIIKSELFYYFDIFLAVILASSTIITTIHAILEKRKRARSQLELIINVIFYTCIIAILVYGALNLFSSFSYIIARNTITVNLFYLTLILFILTYLATKTIVYSPMGSVWRAIRENPQRAESLGYNTLIYQLYALAISGALAGVAGSLFSMTTIVNPNTAFSPFNTLLSLLAVILGGTGTLLGPIIGAWVMQYLKLTLSSIPSLSVLSMAVLGVLYIIIILVFPYGIMGTWYYKGVRLRRAVRRMLKGRKL